MMNVNSIEICRDNFKTEDEFRNIIRDAIMVLLNNDYITTVKYDCNDKEAGIVCISYGYADKDYGCPYPYWLSTEQYLMLEDEKDGD